MQEKEEVVDMLVEAGANPNALDNVRTVASVFVVYFGCARDTFELDSLLNYCATFSFAQDGYSPLAKFMGEPPILRKLLVCNADPNGGRALTLAAYNGRMECVEMLVEAGADPLLKIHGNKVRSVCHGL